MRASAGLPFEVVVNLTAIPLLGVIGEKSEIFLACPNLLLVVSTVNPTGFLDKADDIFFPS